MNEQIKALLKEIEEELEENACFHSLEVANDEMIHFDYAHYWDSYEEFADQISQETDNLLNKFEELKQAGFEGFLYVNDYVRGVKANG